MPFEFAVSGESDVSAISESEHVGLISGFRFEGAEGLFVGYGGGAAEGSHILEVFAPMLRSLKEHDAISQKYQLAEVLPDTMAEFDVRLLQLVRDPVFRNERLRLEAYLELRLDLA